jgi:hypothetical protein
MRFLPMQFLRFLIRHVIVMKSTTLPTLPPAPPRRMRLAHHLVIVLAVKVVLLAVLWHAFIKPNKVEVDVGAMGRHIAGGASSVSIFNIPSMSTSPGDNK